MLIVAVLAWKSSTIAPVTYLWFTCMFDASDACTFHVTAVLYANFTTLMWYCGLLEMWTNCDCLRRFLPGASKGTPGRRRKCVKDFFDAFCVAGGASGDKKNGIWGGQNLVDVFFLKCAVTYTSTFNSKIFPGVILPDPFKRDRRVLRVGRGRERRGCIVAVRGGRPWNRLGF